MADFFNVLDGSTSITWPGGLTVGSDDPPPDTHGDLGLFEESDLSEHPVGVIGMFAIRYGNPQSEYTGRLGGIDGTAVIASGCPADFPKAEGGVYGGGFAAVHDGTGHAARMLGVGSEIWLGANASATDLIYYKVHPPQAVVGTATSIYGVHIGDLTDHNGNVTNTYGIYVERAGTYAIWVDDGDTRLDGKASVYGNTDPGVILNVGNGGVFSGAGGFAVGIGGNVTSDASTAVVGVLGKANAALNASINTLIAVEADAPVINAGASVENAYGMYVAAIAGATNNYGIYVAGAGQAALWIDNGATRLDGDVLLAHDGTGKIGFFGSAGAAKQTLTGSKGGNEALANLIQLLAGHGLLEDSTT